MIKRLFSFGLPYSVFVVSAAILLILCSLLTNPPLRAQRRQQSPTLINVVAAYDPPQMNMDAVVIVEHGKMRPPFPEENEAAQKSFAAEYFKPGKKYRITFGGGEVGTATVTESGMGCNNIHATINAEPNPQSTLKLRGQVMGLATSDDKLGKRESSRRAPSEEERAAVMEVVKQIYRSRKTTRAMLRLLTTTNLVATDLDGDGNLEIVGSFVIETPTHARRDLLLIAEPQISTTGLGALTSKPTFKPALVEFHSYNLPPEQFHSAIDFVDQLDIDGDGVGEVFTKQQGFDAYSYAIYKKQNGRWRKVYTFIGDAC